MGDSMHFSAAIFAIATFALAACYGDDTGKISIDASTAIDAPDGKTDASAAINALGTVCSLAAPSCPAGNTCTSIQGVGSTTRGYCSPTCNNMNVICGAGYTGPAGGMAFCALTTPGSTTPTLCAIVCSTAAQCPSGLDCIAVPNRPERVCVPSP